MPDVTISYKDSQIASMDASGTKTLLTEGKYCEDDIVVQYTRYSPNLQSKQVSPATSSQTVSPDNGYDGLSSVTVNAMPSGSATTPATTITANPTISVSASGLITASVSKTQDVTPSVSAGYVSSGTAGTVIVNGSNTQQLTVYNGEHHQPTPANYSVTVSLTNPSNPSAFDVCEIHLYDPSSSMDLIQTITSPTGNATVTVPNSVYGIILYFVGLTVNVYKATTTVTGGVQYSITEVDTVIVEVTANGTITLDGVEYDD